MSNFPLLTEISNSSFSSTQSRVSGLPDDYQTLSDQQKGFFITKVMNEYKLNNLETPKDIILLECAPLLRFMQDTTWSRAKTRVFLFLRDCDLLPDMRTIAQKDPCFLSLLLKYHKKHDERRKCFWKLTNHGIRPETAAIWTLMNNVDHKNQPITYGYDEEAKAKFENFTQEAYSKNPKPEKYKYYKDIYTGKREETFVLDRTRVNYECGFIDLKKVFMDMS